ncbi:MAG TPA: outer membrane beta-barrel protein, partial [Labilithrix sp.]|nr:outer membrane beta-barrel protein [Labilithrix sp.]
MNLTHRTLVRTGIVLLVIAANSRAAYAQTPTDTAPPTSPPTATEGAGALPAEPAAPAEAPTPAPPAPAPSTAETPAATTPAAPAAAPATDAPKLTVGGYVETYYAYNFGTPSNGVTNFRWVDNRHNTFQLSTVVLDFAAELSSFRAHVALHAGPTADGWYSDASEAHVGASGTAPLGASTWKHIQQANIGYMAPLGRGLLLEAGLFLTTVGYEGAAVKDNWN